MKKLFFVLLLCTGYFLQAQHLTNDTLATHRAQDYKGLAEKYHRNANTGFMIASVGVVFASAGYLVNNAAKGNTQYKSQQIGSVLFIAGGLLFNIGIPAWIVNGIKSKRNYEAMKMELTNDGLTLRIRL